MPLRCLLTYELSLSRGVSTYRFTRSATYIFEHDPDSVEITLLFLAQTA